MRAWIVYAFLTLLAWGVWGFFSKLASGYTRPRQTLIFQAAGVMAFGLLVLAMERFHITWSPQGFGWSAAAGFVNFVGFLAFFAAIEKGKVSTVMPPPNKSRPSSIKIRVGRSFGALNGISISIRPFVPKICIR